MHKRVLFVLFPIVLIISACANAGVGGDLDGTQTEIPETSAPATLQPTKTSPNEPYGNTPSDSVGETSPPASTPVPLPDTPTPSPTVGPIYRIQAGTPLELKNFINTSEGCDWMGIGGQVFDSHGSPLTEFIIEVGDSQGNNKDLKMGITGDTPSLGPGGYSIKLSDQPYDTESTFWVQLFGLDGSALSEMEYFSTYQDCEKNFILINLVEIPPGYGLKAVIPLILKNTPIP